jgi:hypothetical protein
MHEWRVVPCSNLDEVITGFPEPGGKFFLSFFLSFFELAVYSSDEEQWLFCFALLKLNAFCFLFLVLSPFFCSSSAFALL